MTNPNVAVVQTAFEAFGRGDIDAILNTCSADCEFYCPGPPIIPYSGTKTGHDEIRSYFESLGTTQSNVDLRIDQFVAQDNSVVAIGRYTSTVSATGKAIDSPVVLTFELENGRIRRHMVIGDTAAIAASYAASAAARS